MVLSRIILFLALATLSPVHAEEAAHRHAIAMHGEAALPEGFSAFPYVNAAAPKGGALRLGVFGTFDSLNTLSIKGNAPPVLLPYLVQTLMMRSLDEPFTLYGLLAESIATPEDRRYVEFRLNPKARFSDGTPVLAKDVLFTWRLLSTRGRPNYRRNAEKIADITMPDARTIRFTFKAAGDLELPLILALTPVLPEHATDPERFESMGFTPFMGSGPYALESLEPGASITLKRRADYWGADLPSQRGYYNFDTLRFEFFRDANTQFEAFKTGALDLRLENDPTKWRTGYDIPAIREGKILREMIPIGTPKGMSGFVFNTRRAVFADARVREAMLSLFDFEWFNANLFGNIYRRTTSFFDESALSFHAAPLSAGERAVLGAAAESLPKAVQDGTWRPPVTNGSGRDRAVIERGVALLKAAGYAIKNGEMRSEASGQPLTFEIMVTSREKERIALAFADNLKQVGIRPVIRLVDPSQYWARLRDFKFDMVLETYPVSASPGQEQLNRWSSRAAESPGTFNWAGVKSPAIDAAIAAMLAARSREAFEEATRALDRLLIAGHYVVPLYHVPDRWVARWARIARPERAPLYDFSPDLFWFEANH